MSDDENIRRRHPWVALLFAIPPAGLGHLYSGKPKAAVIWLAAWVVVASAFFEVLRYGDFHPANVLLPVSIVVGLYVTHWVSAWRTARRQPADYRLRSYNRWYYYVAWYVGVWVILSCVVLLSDPPKGYGVPSVSMANTIQMGETILADMTAYQTESPKPGDIVVFYHPLYRQQLYMKRCVAGPRDTVEIRDKALYVNGERFPDPPGVIHIDTLPDGSQHVLERKADGEYTRDNWGPRVVPTGSYFMLGDNRDDSNDSRYYWTVPGELVIAKVIRIGYSPDWDRIGLRLE